MTSREILLIDDDQICNFLNEKILEQAALFNRIHTVLNGKQALDFLTTYAGPAPDVILIDLNMPVMGGFEFIRVVKERDLSPGSKLVILTSSDSPGDLRQA